MKISALIDALEDAEREHGDVECLIEVILEDCPAMIPVDEISCEDREPYGPSVAILM